MSFFVTVTCLPRCASFLVRSNAFVSRCSYIVAHVPETTLAKHAPTSVPAVSRNLDRTATVRVAVAPAVIVGAFSLSFLRSSLGSFFCPSSAIGVTDPIGLLQQCLLVAMMRPDLVNF